MDDLNPPLNLTDEELLEVRKFALEIASKLEMSHPGMGAIPIAIALERFLVFGDSEKFQVIGQTIGYARVSTADQDLTIQIDQLTAAGCEKVFSEKKSGTGTDDRTELTVCLSFIREGDTLMVTRMDRLARSMADFFKIVALLQKKGVQLKVLLQPEIDTTTTNGRLVMGVMAAFAEFETAVRRERQREGIDRAMAAGVYKNRPGYKGSAHNKKRVRHKPAAPSVAEAIEPQTTPEPTMRKGPFGRWFPIQKADTV